jgi:hypothetical protein
MKTAIVDTKNNSFMAKNTRFYSLKRQKRKAPAPYVFTSRSKAKDFIRLNELAACKLVAPEKIKTTEPRQMSIRRATITCGGRK